MGCGELTDVRVEGITCCDRAADVGRTSWACRLNWPDVAVDRRSFGRSTSSTKRPTTSVQAKIVNGVHFSVWSLRPATTSVP